MFIPILKTSTLILVLAFIPACNKQQSEPLKIPLRTSENIVGTKFFPLPSNPFQATAMNKVPFSHEINVGAIWGATGRDDRGNIYFGASTHGGLNKTAYLYQYNPSNDQVVSQGDVLRQLKRLNLYSDGMGQNKLHSKIYQADDGYLYFSSFDEAGESEGVNPTWGGYLWRKLPDSSQWEVVLSAEEALIAVNTNGRYVYTLGYWNHVLYQYDTTLKTKKRIVIGSVSKHISRNFIVDKRGHAFVPMLFRNAYDELEAYLNEYDTLLNKVASYPIPSYVQEDMNNHHGIVSYTSLKNNDIVFITHTGDLFKVDFSLNTNNKVTQLGKMHPDGKAYITALFPFEGEDYLLGIGKKQGSKKLEWIVHELTSSLSSNAPLKYSEKNLILYGSLTKDNDGNIYAGGRYKGDNKSQPVLIKLNTNK